MSAEEARNILRIGSNQIYSLLKSGKIRSFKIGSVHKIPKWCLSEYIDKAVPVIHKTERESTDDCCIEN